MANKFSSPVGKLAWSNLVTPTLNLKKEREWNCGLVLPEDRIQEIMHNVQERLNARREKDPGFPRENAGLNFPYGPSMKKDGQGNKTVEPGMVLFKFKRPYLVYRKATMTNEQNTPPVLFDSMGHPVLKLPTVNPGSEGRVIYDTYSYDKAGQRGVGLQILGFQVFKLNVSTIEVGALEGGWVADDSQAASWEPPTAEGPSDTDTNW